MPSVRGLTDNALKTRRRAPCVAADVWIKVDNAENVNNVEKDAMEVMEVDTEIELDDEERLTPKVD